MISCLQKSLLQIPADQILVKMEDPVSPREADTGASVRRDTLVDTVKTVSAMILIILAI